MQNENTDPVLLLSIAQTGFLTLKEKIFLKKNIDSPETLALLSINDISAIIGRKPRTAAWNGAETVKTAQRSVSIMKKLGISYIEYAAAEYPALLREVPDAPFMFFYRGNAAVLNRCSVSVVGTRHLTSEGVSAAFAFGRDAACDGCTVVSGLAAGADGKAHEGAVSVPRTSDTGYTAAVLPGGVDSIVPGMHKKLASRILETGGCILSEYIPGTPAEPFRFVQRNRIIAALSPAVVVIQAPPGSGALITAEFAVGYSRDVLFHEAAFCKNAALLSASVKKRLEVQVVRGEKKAYKLENSSEKYLNDGAPVVKNYNDYKLCLSEMPGMRSCKIKNGQMSLFDENLPRGL